MQFKSINHRVFFAVWSTKHTSFLPSILNWSTFVTDLIFFWPSSTTGCMTAERPSLMSLPVCTFLLALWDWEAVKKLYSLPPAHQHAWLHTHTHRQAQGLACFRPRETWHSILFWPLSVWKRLLVCFFVYKWWKRIKLDNTAASAASLHHGRAQGDDKERRRNRMMAQSHRMNDDLSLLMIQGNSTVAISTRKCIISPGHGEGEKKGERQKKCVQYLLNVWWI